MTAAATIPAPHRFTDAAFLFLVLTQLYSLCDVLFSKRIEAFKKRLDRAVDELTLRLEYLKSAEWLTRWIRFSRKLKLYNALIWIVGIVSFVLISLRPLIEFVRLGEGVFPLTVFGLVAVALWHVVFYEIRKRFFIESYDPFVKEFSEIKTAGEFVGAFFGIMVSCRCFSSARFTLTIVFFL